MSMNFFSNIDVVNFCINNGRLKVILWKRESEPHFGEYALPGVIINGYSADDSMEDAVNRVFKDRLTIEYAHIEQVQTVGNSLRDKRGWSQSTVYMSISVWKELESDSLMAVDYEEIESGLFNVPFDHKELIVSAKERLVSKSTYCSLPIMFLSRDEFTISQLVEVYQACVSPKVQAITVRKRVEFLQKIGDVSLTENKLKGKGRSQLIYAHNDSIHYFDRSILCK